MKFTSRIALAIIAMVAAFHTAGSHRAEPSPVASSGFLLSNQLDPNLAQKTAQALKKAAQREARADYWLAVAGLLNDTTVDLEQAVETARDDFDEAMDLAKDQYDARVVLNQDLGDGPYDPLIDPTDFSTTVSNTYFPLVIGRTLIYQRTTLEGLEQIETTVSGDVVDIAGVQCRVARDVETLNGVVYEDTFDFFAQKSDGGVWYFGEVAKHFENGLLDNLDGSWRMNKDGAKPGTVMLAAPAVGDIYRMEFRLNDSEDVGKVISLNNTVTVPAGQFTGCIEVEEFTPVEPTEKERKFYAPNIGLIKEVNLHTGEVLELVQIIN